MPGILDRAEVRRDPRSGRVMMWRGDVALSASAAADVVKDFLGAHAHDLGLDRLGVDNLQLLVERKTPTRTIRRYRQTRNGIPIHDAWVVVQLDRAHRVKKIDLRHAESLTELAGAGPQLTADQALAAARRTAGGTTRLEPKPPEAVYFASKRGLHLAWRVVVPTKDPHDWELVLDAFGGAVLSKRDLIVDVDGSGLVFDPNPVVTAMDNTLRDPTATAGTCGFAGTAIATIDAQRVARPLRDLNKNAANNYVLDGPYCQIHNFGNPNTVLPEQANQNDFNYSSSDERFEAVLIYHHIDTIQRYIQSLGITTAHNSPIQADPHEGGGGAWFSPADGGLHFGNSGNCRVNRGQDADVPLHEYGHAIQADQVPGWGVTNPTTGRAETRAMGEGFGDILACVYFAPDHQFQQEVFEDWIYVPAGLRRVDGTKVYPTDWAFEEHDDGEIWSAALWNIYRDLGGDSATVATRRAARDELLKALILSHEALAPDATMPDGAEALMVTHAELDDQRGVHLMAMLDSFHERGLLPCSASANLHLRDTETDVGVDPVAGAFWNSPDVWVRNSDDDGTDPQNPEHGQDNWFYARVWNRGTVAARAFVVTFNVKTWAGTQFVYPGDFVPCISAACGFDLAPGASTVVKAKWPASMIPATGTHGCLLASVYTPVDVAPTGKHVWEHNNLAQRNLTVVDLLPGDSAVVQLQLGHRLLTQLERFRLEIVRPPRFPDLPVALVHSDRRELEKLFTSGARAPIARPVTTAGAELHFVEPSRVAIRRAGLEPVHLELARDSRVLLTPGARPPAAAARATEATFDAQGGPAIRFAAGRNPGFPFALAPRTRVKVGVKVSAPAGARAGESFDLHVIQRDDQDNVVGGITIRVRVR